MSRKGRPAAKIGQSADGVRRIDREIGLLAQKQRGYVTTAQLLELGLTPAAVKHRVCAGHFARVYAGVYAVGHVPLALVDRAAAAVLACGPKAALSHSSAASLWGFAKAWQLPFEVTAPSGHTHKGIVVHRSTSLCRRDFRRHLAIVVTSPARTVLDNAAGLSDKALARMVNDARLAGWLRLPDLADVVERFPHRSGAARLRELAETNDKPTRSAFEDDFPGFCVRFGLPRPQLNAIVCGYEVDAWFGAQRLAVELDGWDVHRVRQAFEKDRDKDADLLAAGIATVRVARRRMASDPRTEAARLERILDARPPVRS